jgi:hypothetical protein
MIYLRETGIVSVNSGYMALLVLHFDKGYICKCINRLHFSSRLNMPVDAFFSSLKFLKLGHRYGKTGFL